MKKFIKNPRALILAFLSVIAVSLIGSSFTATDSWYESVRPAITPPNIVFPIAWTALYIMIAFSIYFSFIEAKKSRKYIMKLFAINLLANALWSILFFGLHLPILSFIDLVLIWASTLILILWLWKISRKSALLLIPYILWLTFAGLLNFLIAFS